MRRHGKTLLPVLSPGCLLPKPRFGQPCNGCGVCCAVEVCAIGAMAFPGAEAPCPALKMAPDGKRTVCALVALEEAIGMPPVLREALAIGMGCDSEDGEEAPSAKLSGWQASPT